MVLCGYAPQRFETRIRSVVMKGLANLQDRPICVWRSPDRSSTRQQARTDEDDTRGVRRLAQGGYGDLEPLTRLKEIRSAIFLTASRTPRGGSTSLRDVVRGSRPLRESIPCDMLHYSRLDRADTLRCLGNAVATALTGHVSVTSPGP